MPITPIIIPAELLLGLDKPLGDRRWRAAGGDLSARNPARGRGGRQARFCGSDRLHAVYRGASSRPPAIALCGCRVATGDAGSNPVAGSGVNLSTPILKEPPRSIDRIARTDGKGRVCGHFVRSMSTSVIARGRAFIDRHRKYRPHSNPPFCGSFIPIMVVAVDAVDVFAHDW